MKSRLILASFLVAIFMASPVLAKKNKEDNHGSSGCKNGKWLGSYERSVVRDDLLGIPFISHIQFHEGGNATGFTPANVHGMVGGYSSTQGFGSWKCRKDGKVVVSLTNAIFLGNGDDLYLDRHWKLTYLLEVVDKDTLKRVVWGQREYWPGDDPTDPEAGFLYNGTSDVDYTRVTINEGDIDLP